jgi:hypothetical protein
MDDTDENDKKSETIDCGAANHAARRLANPSGTLDTKELGDLGELAFVLAASSKGLAVSKPFGDCRRYDLIVDSGRRLLRIQVKSIYKLYVAEPYRVACSRRQGTTRISYTVDEIDFLAAYLASRDLWYIVPVEEILDKRMIRFFPDGLTRIRPGYGKYEKYKEAWHQLDERAPRATPEPPSTQPQMSWDRR